MLSKKELKKPYRKLKPEIVKRLNEFNNLWKTKNNEHLFAELCFCLLTPQSKARNCWTAILKLKERSLLFRGNSKQIQKFLSKVRFRKNKTKYILKARRLFQKTRKVLNEHDNIDKLRLWLVKNICGFGYKEASHFSRNIGLGKNLAILDRHILKNLKLLGVIDEIPNSLSKSKYLEIEEKLKKFAKIIKIPISHLDLLMWHKETGEIFK